MPDSASGPDERARASDAVRRALIVLARDRGAELITRQAYRGSDMTIRDLEPLAGARAARDIELGARHAARAVRMYSRAACRAQLGPDRPRPRGNPERRRRPGRADSRPGRLHLRGRKPPHRHRGAVRPIFPLAVPVLRPGDQRSRPDRRASRR